MEARLDYRYRGSGYQRLLFLRYFRGDRLVNDLKKGLKVGAVACALVFWGWFVLELMEDLKRLGGY